MENRGEYMIALESRWEKVTSILGIPSATQLKNTVTHTANKPMKKPRQSDLQPKLLIEIEQATF